jgi:hypothetical protein
MTRSCMSYFVASKLSLPLLSAALLFAAHVQPLSYSWLLSFILTKNQAKWLRANSSLRSFYSFLTCILHRLYPLPKMALFFQETIATEKLGKAKSLLARLTSSPCLHHIKLSSRSFVRYYSLQRPHLLSLQQPLFLRMHLLSLFIDPEYIRPIFKSCLTYAEITSGFSVIQITPSGYCRRRMKAA